MVQCHFIGRNNVQCQRRPKSGIFCHAHRNSRFAETYEDRDTDHQPISKAVKPSKKALPPVEDDGSSDEEIVVIRRAKKKVQIAEEPQVRKHLVAKKQAAARTQYVEEDETDVEPEPRTPRRSRVKQQTPRDEEEEDADVNYIFSNMSVAEGEEE